MDLVNLKSSMLLNKFSSWVVDVKIKTAVEKTCFKYFLQFPDTDQVKTTLQMLTALLNFYDEDLECFVFRENTKNFAVDFGLEDILYITGLPIDGKQVSGIEHADVIGTIAQHLSITQDEAKDLLMSTGREKQSYDINLDKLRNKFEKEAISDENLASHVKAYLLYLLGHLLFNTPSHNTVSFMYLPFLELDNIDSYAWGAAVLATLKVSMGKISSGKTTTLSGFTYALMVFAFERFKCLREICCFTPPCHFPLMVGWVNSTHKDLRKRASIPDVTTCLKKLQAMTDEDVDWFPYERADFEGLLPQELKNQIWMVYAKVYSICFENIAKTSVEICWKQLGLQQEDLKSGLAKFKKLKLQQRGPKKNKDWRRANNFYKHCNERWVTRNMFLIKEGISYDGPLVNYEQGGDADGENVEEPIQANTTPISTCTLPNIELILSQSSPRDEPVHFMQPEETGTSILASASVTPPPSPVHFMQPEETESSILASASVTSPPSVQTTSHPSSSAPQSPPTQLPLGSDHCHPDHNDPSAPVIRMVHRRCLPDYITPPKDIKRPRKEVARFVHSDTHMEAMMKKKKKKKKKYAGKK